MLWLSPRQLCNTPALIPCLFGFPVGPGGPVPVLLRDHSGSLAGGPALELATLAACPGLEVVSRAPSGAAHQEEMRGEAISARALR